METGYLPCGRGSSQMQALANKEGHQITIEPGTTITTPKRCVKPNTLLTKTRCASISMSTVCAKAYSPWPTDCYGVTFTEMPDAPKYDPEVTVYDVRDADNNHVAVFMTDYFTRSSKRQGAWMSEFKGLMGRR